MKKRRDSVKNSSSTELSPPDGWDEVLRLIKGGHLADAEARCQLRLGNHLRNAEALFHLALISQQRADWEEALGNLNRALKLNPRSAKYHSSAGDVLYMLGRQHDSAKAYEQALAIAPQHTGALNNLAVVYSMEGRNAEAEALLLRSLALDPCQTAAWLNLCSAVEKLDFRENDVVDYARRAVALAPRDPRTYGFLGKGLLRQGDVAAALEAMKVAIALDPRNPDIHYNIGISYFQLGAVPEAIHSFQTALAIDSRHGKTYLALADILYRLGEFVAAEEACLTASEIYSDPLTTHLTLAKILFALDLHDEALKCYAQYLAAVRPSLPTHANRLTVEPVESVECWCHRNGSPVSEILASRKWYPADIHYFGPLTEHPTCTPVEIPHAYRAQIDNATILPGHEIILLENENIALYDRLIQLGDWHALREDESVPLIGNGHVLVNAAPKSEERIPDGIFLMSEAWYNYAHWLTEQLPRIYSLEKTTQYDGIPILINEGMYPQQVDSLRLVVGSRYPVRFLSRNRRYHVDRLIYLSNLSGFSKRRYRSNERATPADGPFHPEAIEFLRNRLLPQQAPASPFGKRLWISRKQQIKTGQRRFINESEIAAIFLDCGFEVVHPEDHSFQEQIAIFANAEMIAGPGGAGLMNIVFAPPAAKILVFTKNHPQVNFHYFTNIAQVIGQEIAYVCGDAMSNIGVHGFETDFQVSASEAKSALRDFLECSR